MWKLPILFVCEDNGFAATTRTRAMTAGEGPAARAESLGIAAATVDGNDLMAVDETVRRLLAEIRAGGGPRFLLCKTYRLTGHTGADAAAYRSKEEVGGRLEGRSDRAPARSARDRRREARRARRGRERAARAEIDAAFEEAKASPLPPLDARLRRRAGRGRPAAGGVLMARLTYAEASRQAIAEEMRRDATVWAVGEDLGRGGVFGQYKGLVEEFGPERIADAPISEACIMGAAVGAAMMGTRPIVELRFSDFALCAIDELVNQAAKARYMFGGQGRVPLVVREPIGMWRSSAAQHSQSLEGWYTHIPGLVVIAPVDAGRQQGAAQGRDPLRRPGRLPGAQEPVAAGGRCSRRRSPRRDRQGAGGARRRGPDDRVLVGRGAHLPRRGGGAGRRSASRPR